MSTLLWGRRRTALRAALVASALLMSLSACAPTGDSIAADHAAEVAQRIGDDMTPPVIRSREADWLVAQHVSGKTSDLGSYSVRVDALGWHGSSRDRAGAQIDLRIQVEVDAHSASHVGDRSWQAGSSVRCYHYDVIGYRFYDTLGLHEINCDGRTALPLPTPAPLPDLPDNAEELLTQALTNPDAADIVDRLRVLFPQKFITITSDTDAGRLIVAVGVPSERKCIVGVRDPEGVIDILTGFKRIWLEPGEVGCSTRLITNPPR